MRPLKRFFLYGGGKVQNPSYTDIDHFYLLIIVFKKISREILLEVGFCRVSPCGLPDISKG